MSALKTELLRKAVHIGFGAAALTLRWLSPVQAAALAALAVAFNLIVLHRLTRRALLREDERDRGFSTGIATYPLVVLGLILVFHRRLELAAACWMLLALGDGMAALVGPLVRGPRLPWNPRKSWSGLVAFVVYGGLGAALSIRWTQRAVGDGEPLDAIGQSFVATTLADTAVHEVAWLLAACLACAAIAALVESLDAGIDDNILVGAFGAGAFALAAAVEPGRLLDAAEALVRGGAVGLAINVPLAVAARAAGGVGPSGALAGGMIGTLLWMFAGPAGWLPMAAFFVLGTATTRLGYARKAALGIAQERGGRRGAGNAVANAATGVVCAFLAVATGAPEAWTIALTAAFATAAGDTVASEVGQAYGKRHVLVTTLRRVPAGTDGAVSIEGTLAGLAAGAAVAAVGWAVGAYGPVGATIVTVAAFVGTTFESYLGATLERMRRIDNELVNFLNTVVGAAAAFWMWRAWGG